MRPKRSNDVEDYNKPYEPNVLGLKGITYFGVGLLILIIVTFALMWSLLAVMRDQAAETKDASGPLSMSEKERLPPEPRLQSAPGFGVDAPQGRTNLELSPPSAEYRELQVHWAEVWNKGQVDPSNGTQITMPIPMAKELLLKQPIKVKAGADPNFLDESRLVFSGSSAGRMLSEKRR